MATNVDKAEAQMNLTALQQFDPYISDILLKASQVALYLFDHSANKWAKTDIQGTMFVYKRSATPYHGFMIMNRLSLHNLTEPITKELEYTLQEPFLLYKTTKGWAINRFCANLQVWLSVKRMRQHPLSTVLCDYPRVRPCDGGEGGMSYSPRDSERGSLRSPRQGAASHFNHGAEEDNGQSSLDPEH
ncbi:mRNA-decapping enzyme 1A-like [Diadema setosum]|uniref:mRNA-decapping enzyme 1A-like n=1 Tax=Diadema setosum TaxID=31175 RepID=UPI003B3B5E78